MGPPVTVGVVGDRAPRAVATVRATPSLARVAARLGMLVALARLCARRKMELCAEGLAHAMR